MKPTLAKKLLAQTIEDYSAIAEDWHQSRQGKFWPDILFFKNYVKPGDKILDVGCGNGRFLGLLEDKPKVEYIGLDNCSALLAKAQSQPAVKNNPQIKFLKGDILKLPFPDDHFDLVVCIAVLHHIPSQELRAQAVRELIRVLKPQGILAATALNLYVPAYRWLVYKYMFWKIFGLSQMDFKDILLPFAHKVDRYLHAFTFSEFKKLFKDDRLKIEKSGRPKVEGKRAGNYYVVAKKV